MYDITVHMYVYTRLYDFQSQSNVHLTVLGVYGLNAFPYYKDSVHFST